MDNQQTLSKHAAKEPRKSDASTITAKLKNLSVELEMPVSFVGARTSSLLPIPDLRNSTSARRQSLTKIVEMRRTNSKNSLDKVVVESGSSEQLTKARQGAKSASSLVVVITFTVDELLNQGLIFFNRTKYDDADAKWRQAFDQAVKIDDYFNQARVLSNQACLAKQRGSLACHGEYLSLAWRAFVMFYEASIVKHSTPGRWLDVISTSFDIKHVAPFYLHHIDKNTTIKTAPRARRESICESSTQKDKSQGPPIVTFLLDLLSNIGIYLFDAGRYDASRVWLDYGLSLCGTVFTDFPLPSANLNKFVLKCIPSTMSSLEGFFLTVDQLADPSIRLKPSHFHKSTLFSLSRLLSTSGVILMHLGYREESNDSHRRALDIVNFYTALATFSNNSTRVSSLPQGSAPNQLEAAVLSNWAALRLLKLDIGHTLQLCLLAKFKFIESGDVLNYCKQDTNISYLLTRLMTELVKWGSILGTVVVDPTAVRECVRMDRYKISQILTVCGESKDWISEAFFLNQLASLYNTIGNPVEGLKILTRVQLVGDGRRMSGVYPEYIIELMQTTLIKSIALLLDRESDPHILKSSQLHPQLTYLMNALFDVDSGLSMSHLMGSSDALPSSKLSTRSILSVLTDKANCAHSESITPHLLNRKFFSHICATFKSKHTSPSAPQSISQTNCVYVEVLETLSSIKQMTKQRVEIEHALSDAASPVQRHGNLKTIEDIVTLNRSIVLLEAGLARVFGVELVESLLVTLLQINISRIPRESLVSLTDVYLHVIEALTLYRRIGDVGDARLVKTLQAKASECLLMGLNVSEEGMIGLIRQLGHQMTEEGNFEVLVSLQSNPYTS